MESMNCDMITAMELLPQLVLLGGSVWAALSRDEVRKRRLLTVWGVVWVMLAIVLEVENMQLLPPCKCCELSLWGELVTHAFVYGVMAVAVALQGAVVYYLVRWLVRWKTKA